MKSKDTGIVLETVADIFSLPKGVLNVYMLNGELDGEKYAIKTHKIFYPSDCRDAASCIINNNVRVPFRSQAEAIAYYVNEYNGKIESYGSEGSSYDYRAMPDTLLHRKFPSKIEKAQSIKILPKDTIVRIFRGLIIRIILMMQPLAVLYAVVKKSEQEAWIQDVLTILAIVSQVLAFYLVYIAAKDILQFYDSSNNNKRRKLVLTRPEDALQLRKGSLLCKNGKHEHALNAQGYYTGINISKVVDQNMEFYSGEVLEAATMLIHTKNHYCTFISQAHLLAYAGNLRLWGTERHHLKKKKRPYKAYLFLGISHFLRLLILLALMLALSIFSLILLEILHREYIIPGISLFFLMFIVSLVLITGYLIGIFVHYRMLK